MKKQLKNMLGIILAMMLALSMILTGCNPVVPTVAPTESETETPTEKATEAPTDAPTDAPTEEPTEGETYEIPTEHIDTHDIDEAECERFRAYGKELTADMLEEAGTFNIHFFIKDPVAFGIDMGDEPYWPSYEVTDHDAQDVIDGMNEIKARLAEFDYDKLDEDCRLTYDMLMNYAETNIKTANLPNLYEPLSYSNGITSYLPTEFAIYTIENREDVETYLTLMEKIPEYFASIISYEKSKAAEGILMDAEQLDKTVEQCESFLESQEDSFLYTTFEERIRKLDYTEDEITALLARNKEAVDTGLYDSFRYIIDELNKLQGQQKYSGAVCHYPQGKEYYEARVMDSTGSSMTPDEMFDLLESTLKSDNKKLEKLLRKDSRLSTNASGFKYPSGTPEELLKRLEKDILPYFPQIDPVDYKVSYVDPSLRDYLSPAFYFSAPLDVQIENQIFINCDEGKAANDIYLTLAHEGYPGHLYQMNYMQQNGASPLRRLLGTNGFTEGYAEYIELFSYSFMLNSVNENTITYMQTEAELLLCLYGILDIGINYKGWSIPEAAAYLNDLGYNGAAAKEVAVYLISDPGGYLDYVIGELEIKELKKDAEAVGMSLMNFHKRLLDLSGAPFDMIHAYMFEE